MYGCVKASSLLVFRLESIKTKFPSWDGFVSRVIGWGAMGANEPLLRIIPVELIMGRWGVFLRMVIISCLNGRSAPD